MNKKEIRKLAAMHGIEAYYQGNSNEDRQVGFYFIPVLLNNLENLKINQKARLNANPDNVKLKEELKAIIEKIEIAKQKKIEFEQTEIYTTEMKKHETSTV